MPKFEFRPFHLSSSLFRSTAFAALTGALALGAQAQEIARPVVAAPTVTPLTLFAGVAARPTDLATLAGASYSSSSDSLSPADTIADPTTLTFAGSNAALQPPPRRRYGRPRYNDNMHNSDGSNKYTFEGAVGLTLPSGDTYHYFNTSYGFSVGGGRQFNKHFAVLAQFDYDHFGVNGQTLNNQENLYNSGCTDNTQADDCLGSIDGSNHVWSFTLDPRYTFLQGDKVGAYVVGGVGFYHKVTNFTTPEEGEVCYYFCETVEENAVIDHYTSNAPGFNGGFGLTYKFSRFADERFFVEARYVFVDNSQRYGFTYNSNTGVTGPPNADQNNAFPANSNRTTYIPIKFGIQF